MARIQNEGIENQLTSCDIISLAFMSLNAFPESLEHFGRGKSSSGIARIQETF